MNDAEARCFIGTVLGYDKQHKVIDDAVVQEALGNDAHAQAQYAEAATDSNAKAAEAGFNANPDTPTAKVSKAFADATGIKPHDLLKFFGKPTDVLGEDIVKPVTDIILQHKNTYGHNNYKAYQADVAPQLKAYRDYVLPTLDAARQNYLNEWIQSEIRGVSLYGRKAYAGGVNNPVAKAVDNVIGNLISNNPAIALYNVFEVMPKAQAYAIQELGPVGAQGAVLKAFGDFMRASGGQFWKRIPELEARGVYSVNELNKFEQKLDKAFGVHNVLDITENPLRSIAYYLGEAVGAGKGLQAVENIAFAYRPGNMPAMLWNREGAGSVHLMRYSIESMKLYGSLVKNLANPEKAANAAFALAGFHLITAMQTGFASSVPLPIYQALPDDIKQQLDELSSENPLFNIAGKATGLNLTKQSQPLGGVAFGLGNQILTQNLGQGVSTSLKGVKELATGEAEQGSMDLLQGLLTAGQVAKLPGINFTTLRLLKAARKSYENGDLSAAGLTNEVKDQFHVLPKEE